MLFYTFQNSQVLADMVEHNLEIYIPNWAGMYSLTGSNKEAYDYLVKRNVEKIILILIEYTL